MTKRRMLVVGYPKSGNTWLTRLAAELLGAPVKGFWREPQSREIAVEGESRVKVTLGTRRLTAAARRESLESIRVCRMILTLADSDREVSEWTAQPWDEHIYAYLDAGACIIRYEDLLATPERECRRLLAHFGVERSAAQIQHAIAAQSFQAAKKRYQAQGDDERAKFLRTGQAGAWSTELSDAQRQFCRERFSSMLAHLDYKIADAPSE